VALRFSNTTRMTCANLGACDGSSDNSAAAAYAAAQPAESATPASAIAMRLPGVRARRSTAPEGYVVDVHAMFS
jgi:hypothetical protein